MKRNLLRILRKVWSLYRTCWNQQKGISKSPVETNLMLVNQSMLRITWGTWARLSGAVVKNLPANVGDAGRPGFNPCVEKIPWSRKWQFTLVFLPGKSQGQKSLVGYAHAVSHIHTCVVLVAQSCLTLCDPMHCSLWGSSVPGILQARILEWLAIPFSRGSSQTRDWTQVSCVAGRFFNIWVT